MSQDEYKLTRYIQVFPNPANDIINVVCEIQNIETIRVYDLQGRELMAKKHTGALHEQELNISALQTGIYIIQVNNAYTEKITKL